MENSWIINQYINKQMADNWFIWIICLLCWGDRVDNSGVDVAEGGAVVVVGNGVYPQLRKKRNLAKGKCGLKDAFSVVLEGWVRKVAEFTKS